MKEMGLTVEIILEKINTNKTSKTGQILQKKVRIIKKCERRKQS